LTGPRHRLIFKLYPRVGSPIPAAIIKTNMVNHPQARLPVREVEVGEPLRVLVVDDNRDAADSLALLLRLCGHQACAAYDGPAAAVHRRAA
jgi:hypothetical protein